MTGSYTPCTLIHWNAGYESDGGLGLESVVRATLMRTEEELWCSVVFNILQQFLLSSCGTATSKMKWKSKNSEKKGAERHTAWRYLISIRSTSPSIHWKSGDRISPRHWSCRRTTRFLAEKRIAIGIGLGLFHNSLRKRVSVKRGAGVGVYLFFFLRECCLRVRVMVRLGLFRVRVRFRIRVRVRVRVSVNPSPKPKTAFFKKR